MKSDKTRGRAETPRSRRVKRVMRIGPALVLAATFLCADTASAQLFQWTPEQLIKYTKKNPYDRFPDGRPKVPDELLATAKASGSFRRTS